MHRFQVTVDAELKPIMSRYMEIRWQELAELEAALKSGDSDAVSELGHKLKGTGASYGFDKLTELGAVIEDAGRHRDLDAAEAPVRAVHEYLQNVDILYE